MQQTKNSPAAGDCPRRDALPAGAPDVCDSGQVDDGAVETAAVPQRKTTGKKKGVERGLSAELATSTLRELAWARALRLANRFRVIRTVDVAAHCYPERGFKAALTAAQRVTRGLVKARLLQRYRTDRFQTVYGLTQRGAAWLHDRGIDAAASLRRVSDMSNPEHRLWAQFVVLTAEARGLQAWTETEALQTLNASRGAGAAAVQGMLRVHVHGPRGEVVKQLRPDALIAEADGATWVEIDRSARGSGRAADLKSLVLSAGARLADGQTLARIGVFCRNERIRRRVVAVLEQLVEQTRDSALMRGRRQVRRSGTAAEKYEVWLTEDRHHSGGRVSLVDRCAAHVVIQLLPTWLPRFRLDRRRDSSDRGWLTENYLPYQRPRAQSPWPAPVSPLLASAGLAGPPTSTRSHPLRGGERPGILG